MLQEIDTQDPFSVSDSAWPEPETEHDTTTEHGPTTRMVNIIIINQLTEKNHVLCYVEA